MKVLRISARDTYPIRQQMLRPGRPLSECAFQGDDEDQTFHLGAFVENKLVSVASFYFDRHPDIDGPYQYRLRGMATLPDFQRRGLSSELLRMAFPIIKQNQCDILWCNAREAAVPFYEQVGFKKLSEVFDIPGIGPHVLMMKNLS